jgi:hypothetical protein
MLAYVGICVFVSWGQSTNYNQHNQGMSALAGLLSYLPAAQPEVRWF